MVPPIDVSGGGRRDDDDGVEDDDDDDDNKVSPIRGCLLTTETAKFAP